MRPTLQGYIIKMMTGWLPVNHHLNKMMSSELHCHLCKNDETIAHLYQCTHRQIWQHTFQQNLNKYLLKIMTQTEVCHTINTHFENIIHNPEVYHHFFLILRFLPDFSLRSGENNILLLPTTLERIPTNE